MIKERTSVESYYVLALAYALQMNFLVAHYADLCIFLGHRAGIFLFLCQVEKNRERHTLGRGKLDWGLQGEKSPQMHPHIGTFSKYDLKPP